MTPYTALDKLHGYLVPMENQGAYLVGAVALDGNDNIIAMSSNSYSKTHPYMKELAEKVGNDAKQYLHAEVSAIIKSHGKAETLIVGRLLKDGTWAMAKPCEICAMAIAEADIDTVYYTGESGELILFKEGCI